MAAIDWRLEVVAKKRKVRLKNLRAGAFFSFNECVAVKSEYGDCECIIVGSGEMFWGGAKSKDERRELLVSLLEFRHP